MASYGEIELSSGTRLPFLPRQPGEPIKLTTETGEPTRVIFELEDKAGNRWIVAGACGMAQPVGGRMPPMDLGDMMHLGLKMLDFKVIS
jgi:hypothetical protein